MKQWKRITSCCLAAVMAAGPTQISWAASPEFSRTAEEWAMLKDNVMDYGELADLVHEYNATVLNNNVEYNKMKNDGDITSDDIAESYRDQANDVRSNMTGDNVGDAQLEIRALQLEKQADENVFDLLVYKMNYEQTEASLVMTAQTNMISYHQDILQLAADRKNREMLEFAYNITVVGRDSGTKTQMDVLSAQENLQKADAGLQQSEAALLKLKQTLCVMLGWQYNAEPQIQDIPAADMTRIDHMDPSADLAKALESNYSLKINKRKLANATVESSKESLRNTIKDNEQKIGADLKNKYQSVLQARIAYERAVSELNYEAQNLSNINTKYQGGSVSQMELVQAQSSYAGKEAAAKIADMELFKAMETYDWAVNGMASAS